MAIFHTSSPFCCCDDPLPENARAGITLFNRGLFFDCHEALEEAWRAEPGPCRLLYQALLQLGVALYHVQRNNTPGARKVLARAEKKLAQLPDTCQGVALSELKSYARMLALLLARQDADRIPDPPHIRVQEPGAS